MHTEKDPSFRPFRKTHKIGIEIKHTRISLTFIFSMQMWSTTDHNLESMCEPMILV